jgi:hypothetical protein
VVGSLVSSSLLTTELHPATKIDNPAAARTDIPSLDAIVITSLVFWYIKDYFISRNQNTEALGDNA